MKKLFGVVLILGIIIGCTEQSDRFQMVQGEKYQAYVIDTKEGHLWKFWPEDKNRPFKLVPFKMPNARNYSSALNAIKGAKEDPLGMLETTWDTARKEAFGKETLDKWRRNREEKKPETAEHPLDK